MQQLRHARQRRDYHYLHASHTTCHCGPGSIHFLMRRKKNLEFIPECSDRCLQAHHSKGGDYGNNSRDHAILHHVLPV